MKTYINKSNDEIIKKDIANMNEFCIKNIDFSIKNRDPLNVRETPEFSKYFDSIWKELDVHA